MRQLLLVEVESLTQTLQLQSVNHLNAVPIRRTEFINFHFRLLVVCLAGLSDWLGDVDCRHAKQVYEVISLPLRTTSLSFTAPSERRHTEPLFKTLDRLVLEIVVDRVALCVPRCLKFWTRKVGARPIFYAEGVDHKGG